MSAMYNKESAETLLWKRAVDRAVADMQQAAQNVLDCQDWPERQADWARDFEAAKAHAFSLIGMRYA